MANSAARRERLRERSRQERAQWLRETDAIKAAGGACRLCAHVAKTNIGNKRYCTLDSDHHGYAMVAYDHACPRFKPIADAR